MRTVIGLSFLFWVFIALVAPDSASAYVDPGTGSYVFQILIAGILSAAVSARVFWSHVKSFFARLLGRPNNIGDHESD